LARTGYGSKRAFRETPAAFHATTRRTAEE
jgi:hypothetical protein